MQPPDLLIESFLVALPASGTDTPRMQGYPLEKRTPPSVMILSLVTCGIYMFFWYYKMYQELTTLGGRTPTRNSYGMDLLLVIVTCGIWGIYVDYQISLELTEIQRNRGMKPSDTAVLALILDVSALLTGFLTYYVTSAVQQDEMNRIIDDATANPSAQGTVAVPGGPGETGRTGPTPENPYSS